MSEPRAVADGLAGARRELEEAAARAAADEPPRRPLHDFDPVAEATITMAQIRERQWATVMPARFSYARLSQPDAPYAAVVADLTEWAAAPGGRNLFLHGPCGTGKTSAALAACHDAYVRGDDVAFWPLVDLLDALRPGGDEYAMANLRAPDILVVDDLGSEKATDWTWERLYALVNYRWMHEKPTVATTNAEVADLKAAMDERLWSRLVGNDAVVLRLSGEDRRRTG